MKKKNKIERYEGSKNKKITSLGKEFEMKEINVKFALLAWLLQCCMPFI